MSVTSCHKVLVLRDVDKMLHHCICSFIYRCINRDIVTFLENQLKGCCWINIQCSWSIKIQRMKCLTNIDANNHTKSNMSIKPSCSLICNIALNSQVSRYLSERYRSIISVVISLTSYCHITELDEVHMSCEQFHQRHISPSNLRLFDWTVTGLKWPNCPVFHKKKKSNITGIFFFHILLIIWQIYLPASWRFKL